MSRILLRAHKDPFRIASAEETLRSNLIGNNTGNLVFSQAVSRILSGNRVDAGHLRSRSADQINGKYDHVVIPLANAFRHKYIDALETFSDLIENLTVPVTVLGVGAQASLSGVHKRSDELTPVVRRFVRAVLKRSGPIGVRGEFTRQYLRELGFGDDDVTVIGCPSMFMYGPDLKISKSAEQIDSRSRIALNISPYVKEMGPISLAHADRYPHLVYLAQNHQTLQLLLEGTYPMGEGAKMRSTGVPVHLDHPLIRHDRIRFFLDPQTWFDHLADYDFSFGTRIHGTIAAILAGTPAVLLAHDSRTRELADLHQIPSHSIKELPRDVDAAELYAGADWEDMNSAHGGNWRRFESFLAHHDLSHVYAEGGDRGRAFDQRLRAITFPPPVGTLMGAEPSELYAMKRELITLRGAENATSRTKPSRTSVQRLRALLSRTVRGRHEPI